LQDLDPVDKGPEPATPAFRNIGRKRIGAGRIIQREGVSTRQDISKTRAERTWKFDLKK